MDIKEEFKKINQQLLNQKDKTKKEIKQKTVILEEQIKTKLKEENISYKNQINIDPIINKFYQKLVNMNNFVEENLIFNIKNKPEDIMFLQKNVISINIESKSVEVKEELKGIFELLLYNLTVENRLDAYLYKKVKQIITIEQNKIIPIINEILNDLLEQNKKIIINKYNEILKNKINESPDKYEINKSFLYSYAQKYLIKTSYDMIELNKNNTLNKIKEQIETLKNNITSQNKIKKQELDKIIDPLYKYINEFINTLFNKLNQLTTSTADILYSNNLKKDLEKYNNYTNKIIDKEIILDREFENIRKKLIQNKKVKKDIDNIKQLEDNIAASKTSIISNIKIIIMDILKTNSFNINKTITCTNFIKYSTNDKIEDMSENDLIKMFNLLIKNE